MTVHALVPQCAEPRERYYELFKMQNSQKFFRGFAPGLVLGELEVSLSCTTVFFLARIVEKPTLQKISGYSIVSIIKHINIRDLFPLVVSVCPLGIHIYTYTLLTIITYHPVSKWAKFEGFRS